MSSELWKDVLEKIEETTVSAQYDEPSDYGIDKEICAIYEKVSLILSRYKSGKLPKAFKVIPSLNNWEQLLALTRPAEWTPNATHQATKLFISTLSPKLASKFCHQVLLPKIQKDFDLNKKVNPHYYQALMLAISKPSAFFSGILLPLCADMRTTQRQAAIMGSVIKKMSIPVLYSAAALIKLTKLDFYGPRAIVMRTLIEKKYSLPQSALHSLVEFIETSSRCAENNTVIWQQLVLSVCVKYGADLSPLQKSAIIESARRLQHGIITSEIVASIEKTYSILS